MNERREPRFCHLCGAALGEQAFFYRHPSWEEGRRLYVCQTCQQQAARCLHCGLPLATTPGGSSKGLCPTCAAAAPHCLACQRPIVRLYAEVGGRGPYCQECIHERGRCDVCGVPLDDDHFPLTDGRVLCGQCHATAIYDQAVAHALYRRVDELIRDGLGLTLNVPTGLTLVGRDQLAEIASRQNGEPGQDLTRALGVYARRGIRRGLYVQSGLPRSLFLQVTAHEWAHAWQGENCPLLNNLLIKEGFAEWVAYKTLLALGDDEGIALLLARSDLYGQGLRLALEREGGGGPAAVIEWCRAGR